MSSPLVLGWISLSSALSPFLRLSTIFCNGASAASFGRKRLPGALCGLGRGIAAQTRKRRPVAPLGCRRRAENMTAAPS